MISFGLVRKLEGVEYISAVDSHSARVKLPVFRKLSYKPMTLNESEICVAILLKCCHSGC